MRFFRFPHPCIFYLGKSEMHLKNRLPSSPTALWSPVSDLEKALPRTAFHVGLSLFLLTNSASIGNVAPRAAFAQELSSSQKLAAEAWRVTDKDYVDREFAGQDWFLTRQKMVQRKYPESSAPKEVRFHTVRSSSQGSTIVVAAGL